MSDRELLEMAAKAAGIEFVWRARKIQIGLADTWGVRQYRDELQPFLKSGLFWVPLDDDGDALRLAVKLQLTICNEHVSSGSAYCITSGFGLDSDAPSFPEVDSGESESEVIPDDYAATRRAIVMAAAQIGSGKL